MEDRNGALGSNDSAHTSERNVSDIVTLATAERITDQRLEHGEAVFENADMQPISTHSKKRKRGVGVVKM